jgi:hypothetical protein
MKDLNENTTCTSKSLFRRDLGGLIMIFTLLFSGMLQAANDSTKISINGQITTWVVGQVENPYTMQVGGRFVPTLLGDFSISPTSTFDFEASLNLNGALNFNDFNYNNISGNIKPYRVWARYSGENWEVRAGLQKINFGQAKMFRPLMWFDAMDVRDPLQLTDGVNALLGKYFFSNNANIWLWGLIGNKDPKGYEQFGSAQWEPELGGRFQTPFGLGEIALSTHYRTINYQNPLSSTLSHTNFGESRVGLDGKWDVGIGLWFETSITYTDIDGTSTPFLYKMKDMWNVGADYTLPIGNGVGVTLEYFRYHFGEQFLTKGDAMNLIGGMVSYPISILDNVSAMVFYLPDTNSMYNYLSWSRTYDKWSLYVFGFWNPSTPLAIMQSQGSNLFAGKGVQVMLNYNF